MGFFLDCKGSGYLLGALLLLAVPVNWILSAALAAFVHEASHWFAIHLTGNRVLSVSFSGFRICMHTAPLSGKEEAFCALAGPVGSMLLLFLCRWLPAVALCGFVQGFFNLLPVYPLDGGRIARILLHALFPERKAEQAQRLLTGAVLAGIAALGIYGTCRLSLGFSPLVLSLILIFRLISENVLANRSV